MKKTFKLDKEMFHPDNLTMDDLKAFKKRYQNSPILFAEEILGVEPDTNQRKIMQLFQEHKRIAVGAARGVGKTITISMLSCWLIATRPGAKVLVSSNTAAQSKSTLFSPLVTMLRTSLIGEWFDYSSEQINFNGDPTTAFIRRLIWSENNVEGISGYHAKHMYYFLDESSKYPNSIIENLLASCTEDDNRMLLTSNPTRTTGFFYDTQEKKSWEYVSIDGRDSKWTNKELIDELIQEYGEDSDIVRVQVKGEFPRFGSSSIIPAEILSRSLNGTKPNQQTNDVISIGWDIGGQGDPNVWCVRIGNWVEHIETMFGDPDNDEPIIQKTVELVDRYKAHKLFFDKTGMGYYMAPRIKPRLPHHLNCQVVGIQFGDGSPSPDSVKMRDWIYTRLRDWVYQGGLIGSKPKFKEQLLATEYVLDQNGKIKLIPKKNIKEAIGQSPDESDALALSCAYQGNLVSAPFRTTNFESKALGKMLFEAGAWE